MMGSNFGECPVFGDRMGKIGPFRGRHGSCTVVVGTKFRKGNEVMAKSITIRIRYSLVLLTFAIAMIVGCAGGPLTTREKGAAIGTVGGAATGGIIGAAVGAPGTGAAVGGALGLGAGALIGDQLQARERDE